MALKKPGLGGGVGALAGIALVVWIEPTTDAGIGVVIAVCVLVGTVVGGLAERLGGRGGKGDGEPGA